jgi:hypothetical protein
MVEIVDSNTYLIKGFASLSGEYFYRLFKDDQTILFDTITKNCVGHNGTYYDALHDGDTAMFVFGFSSDQDSFNYLFIKQIDYCNNIKWIKLYPPIADTAYTLDKAKLYYNADSTNIYALMQYYNKFDTVFKQNNKKYYLNKFDRSGNLLRSDLLRSSTVPKNSIGHLLPLSDGSLVYWYQDSAITNITKYDGNMNIIKNKVINTKELQGQYYDAGFSCLTVNDKGEFIGAGSASLLPDYQIIPWIFKLDKDFNFLWEKAFFTTNIFTSQYCEYLRIKPENEYNVVYYYPESSDVPAFTTFITIKDTTSITSADDPATTNDCMVSVSGCVFRSGFDASDYPVRIAFYNEIGAHERTVTINSPDETIDFSDLPSGVYFYEMQNVRHNCRGKFVSVK